MRVYLILHEQGCNNVFICHNGGVVLGRHQSLDWTSGLDWWTGLSDVIVFIFSGVGEKTVCRVRYFGEKT